MERKSLQVHTYQTEQQIKCCLPKALGLVPLWSHSDLSVFPSHCSCLVIAGIIVAAISRMFLGSPLLFSQTARPLVKFVSYLKPGGRMDNNRGGTNENGERGFDPSW